MNLLAEQPYIKVERQVTSINQTEIEHVRKMYLYDEKIVTRHREFLIEEVMDMSYRPIGGSGGLLYIHTIRGVFSYTVKTSPEPFIQIFNEEIQKNSH